MTKHHCLLMLLPLLVAGCADANTEPPSAPETSAGPVLAETPSPDAAVAPPETTVVRVYSTAGVIASVAKEDGGATGQPPAPQWVRVDAFSAPVGTVALNVTAYAVAGTWSGGLEIVSETGAVVFRQDILLSAATPLGTHSIRAGGGIFASDEAWAGNYSVLYRMVGAADVRVHVDAVVQQATASPTPADDASTDRSLLAPVYASRGVLVGAVPTNPMDRSPLTQDLPTTRIDGFWAPAGTDELRVHLDASASNLAPGALSGTIDITAEDGELVHREQYLLKYDGVSGSLGIRASAVGWPATPGYYTIAYRLVGAADMSITIAAWGPTT